VVEFKLPDIGEGLSEAELLEWMVSVGDRVNEGDEVAVISTDKVNVELTAPASGRVAALHGEPGDVIAVGTLIMRIDSPSQSAHAIDGDEPNLAEEPVTEAGEEQSLMRTTPRAAAKQSIKAAPIVRRYAAGKAVNLDLITGTGPGGQVLRRDIDAFLEQPGSIGPDQVAASLPVKERLKLKGARLTAARQLAQANRTVVATTIQFEVNAGGILQAAGMQKTDGGASLKATTNDTVSPTAVVAHCLIRVLAEHPHFNATINEEENELLMHEDINLGMAVNTAEGLLVPVVNRVQELTLGQLADSITQTAVQAREGRLDVGQLRGSTFTLSSTGSLESAVITGTTPIINWPNAAILWMSRIRDTAKVVDGVLEAVPVMSCSLSFDHRYLHGADGMAFINDFDAACQNISQNI
jgi:pyruvate dehydrogenase E2 component (dihydrolipoamide acetyltransferase)